MTNERIMRELRALNDRIYRLEIQLKSIGLSQHTEAMTAIGETDDGLCDLSSVCDELADMEDAICELSMEEV